MPNFDIAVPQAVHGRVVDAFCAVYGYQDKVQDPNDSEKTINNPVSKPQFVKAKIAEYVQQVVAGYEAEEAANKARSKARDKAATDIAIT
jgi:hypothetical protein